MSFNKKYKLTISPNLYSFKDFGEVDLRHLTLEKADELYAKKFPYLQKRPKELKTTRPAVKNITKASKPSHNK